jgi:hypothetical protein
MAPTTVKMANPQLFDWGSSRNKGATNINLSVTSLCVCMRLPQLRRACVLLSYDPCDVCWHQRLGCSFFSFFFPQHSQNQGCSNGVPWTSAKSSTLTWSMKLPRRHYSRLPGSRHTFGQLYEDGGRRVTCTDGTLRGAYVLIFTSNELTRLREDTEGSWSAYEVGRREDRRRVGCRTADRYG